LSPGSWLPNWLQGWPTMRKGLPAKVDEMFAKPV
jgi:hypothetical protein